MAALLAELLAARAADGDVERRVGRGQAVGRVVVGAEDGLVVDRLAGAVDRAVHVDVTDPLARVVLARDPELVGRGALLPARAHHRVPAARVYPHEVRAVAVVAEDRRGHLERCEPVRVGAQLGGVETGSGPADEGVFQGRAGVVVERPHDELVVRDLRHQDRVDDREDELRRVLAARAHEVVALRQRPLARERRLAQEHVVPRAGDRLGPGPERRLRRLEVADLVAEVVQEPAALVAAQRPEREVDRRHVRDLEIEDGLVR